MCRRITCDRCGKPSFAGCGLHVEQVLGDVPPSDRCRCGVAEAPRPAQPSEARDKDGAAGTRIRRG